uniref:Uncharacterized protein n=1 Tax=Arundo donax TaxID=35708 RepID=A0A0A9GZJ8_ARUDO
MQDSMSYHGRATSLCTLVFSIYATKFVNPRSLQKYNKTNVNMALYMLNYTDIAGLTSDLGANHPDTSYQLE